MLFRELRQIRDLAVDIGKGITGGMDRMDVADDAGPDPLTDAPDGVRGVPLVAELRHDLVFFGASHEPAYL